MWLTGLSGGGKSTIANALHSFLSASHHQSYVLDGDILRRGLCADLGFSEADRHENIRRAAFVASTLMDAGIIVIAAFITPYRSDRLMVRQAIPTSRLVEAYVDCPLDVCMARDPKGLYKAARAGRVPHFTGISAPYEIPLNADLHLLTAESSVSDAVTQIHSHLLSRGLLTTTKLVPSEG